MFNAFEFFAALHARRNRRTRVACHQAIKSKPAQMAGRGFSRRHDLLRVFVAQFIEAEAAAVSNAQRLGHQFGWIQTGNRVDWPQRLLGVRLRVLPQFSQRPAQADGGEHILQGLAAFFVHQHVAGGDGGQSHCRCQRQRLCKGAHVICPLELLDGNPERTGEAYFEQLQGFALPRHARRYRT